MLPTKNRVISVSRLTTTWEKRAYVSLITWMKVYINQSTEEIQSWFDNQPSFYIHKMLTEGNHATIDIGDRVTDDQGNTFDIRGKSVHKSLVWTHHQYLLTEAFE